MLKLAPQQYIMATGVRATLLQSKGDRGQYQSQDAQKDGSDEGATVNMTTVKSVRN